MFSRRLIHIVVCASAVLPLGALAQYSPGSTPATESPTSSDGAGQRSPQANEPIYGRQMMTPEEMNAYRDKMRAAKTQDERDRLREEHHAEMKARARERGITLPDAPPARGQPRRGMEPGTGMGPRGRDRQEDDNRGR